ncbi:MBL fold metallo-hydrolase [Paenibacillus tarimensis]|nr:MBL fold metallo-hydrolase [Paenibacillus tarimensis]
MIDLYSREAVIIDPAWELDAIVHVITQADAKLTKILLTHSHSDHVHLVDALLRRYNPQVYMSRQEIDYYGFTCRNLNPVHDGEMIPFTQSSITCILTPGHTAGGVCYLWNGILFSGDTVFIEGCGMCSGPGGCPNGMYESIQRLKKLLAPEVRIYPGHCYGREVGCTFGYVMANNLYFQIENKEMFISFRMRSNQKNLFDFQ